MISLNRKPLRETAASEEILGVAQRPLQSPCKGPEEGRPQDNEPLAPLQTGAKRLIRVQIRNHCTKMGGRKGRQSGDGFCTVVLIASFLRFHLES